MRRFNFKDQIVFENTNYLAINKPPGVSSLHERIGLANSVFEQAKKYNNHLQLCHRLDKETSGLKVIAPVSRLTFICLSAKCKTAI